MTLVYSSKNKRSSFIELGIFICLSEGHLLNAISPILKTVFGITISESDSHLKNAHEHISFTEGGIIIFFNDEQLENIDSLIILIEGISMPASDEQNLK